MAHTAATPSTHAIALTQRSKNVLNPPPLITSRSSGGETTCVSKKQLSRLERISPLLKSHQNVLDRGVNIKIRKKTRELFFNIGELIESNT